MGFKDLGCYGSDFYETPNIDRLARQGMRFTDAYAACPVCSPTRASILTGKYPARLNLTEWIGGSQKPTKYLEYMPLKEFTVAEALKEAGYATCSTGKWHLGHTPYFPEHQGFDVNIGGNRYGLPPSYFCPFASKRDPNRKVDVPCSKGDYLTDRLTDEAIEFIRQNKDKPFFVYLSHYAVHNPQQAKEKIIEKYKRKHKRMFKGDIKRFEVEDGIRYRCIQDDPVYAAMVESVDESVGRVLCTLDELNLSDNTIVFFMSDNGGLSTSEGSPTSNLPLKAGKGFLYEGGIREPMIVKWPGVVEAGRLCSEPVTSTDFYPTILQMASVPLRPEQHIDGLSLAGLLKGGEKLKRDALYWHYPHYSNQGGRPSGAIRSGDYKLIEHFEDNRIELYNLREDIGETNNLSNDLEDKAKVLSDKLNKWREEVEARMPTF